MIICFIRLLLGLNLINEVINASLQYYMKVDWINKQNTEVVTIAIYIFHYMAHSIGKEFSLA